MSVKVIKTNAIKMQYVQIKMAIILVLTMMDSWVMASVVQVYKKSAWASKTILFCDIISKYYFSYLGILLIIIYYPTKFYNNSHFFRH